MPRRKEETLERQIPIHLLAKFRKLVLFLKKRKKMRDIMSVYYMESKSTRVSGRKVAWITSGGPVEPLLAMDVIPVYPENHGAMIGASKMGAGLCEIAEEMGYAADLCSYARSDIACSRVNGGPIGGLPRPDMLVCCNNICGTVLKWYEVQARYYNAPLFILDTPFCRSGFPEGAAAYVRRQLDEYLAFIEEACGRKFDYGRLARVGELSVEAQRLWQKVLDTAAVRPAPLSAFDAFYHLALIVTLRGTDEAVGYYRQLLAKMEDRAARGIGAVQGERYRLLWDNIPIWPRTKWLAGKFAAHKACLVADTYTSAWCGSLQYIDENNFLDSMAEAYTRIYLNIGVDEMALRVVELVDKYQADGIVMHSNRSCKPYSFGQYEIARRVQSERGIPSLIIEADMVDERMFAEGQVENRIDAFMEIVKAGRRQ